MRKLILFMVGSAIFSLAFSQNATSWYFTREIAARAWLIGDNGADNMYLIEGNDSSLLVDTGLGVADLASFVKKLTSKPLIVVNTHGHPDHAGANYQFEKVYVYPADFINNQVACVKGILDGTLERKPYQSFAGNAMVSVSGRASVAFNPGNL